MSNDDDRTASFKGLRRFWDLKLCAREKREYDDRESDRVTGEGVVLKIG